MAFLVCLLFRESIGMAITKSFVIFERKRVGRRRKGRSCELHGDLPVSPCNINPRYLDTPLLC